MKVADLYDKVTQRIISELEAGAPPWVRPWRDARIKGVGMMPSNLVTGRLYSGSNVLLLWMDGHDNGYQSLQYCTYKQALDIGANVRKGEKAAPVIFTKHDIVRDEESGEDKARTIARCFYVFNVFQLDNVPEKYMAPQQKPEEVITYQKAKMVRANAGVEIRHGSNQACYYPSRDTVDMPYVSAFINEDEYWGTCFHELTHAVGHKSRLNRDLSGRFGDDRYAVEEIIVELASAYLCAMCDIPPSFRSAAYIDSWIKVLKADKTAIFSASSHAQKAATYLWERAYPQKEVAKEPENELERA